MMTPSDEPEEKGLPAATCSDWRDPRIPVGLQLVWWPVWRKATWIPLVHFTRFDGSGYGLIYKWAVMFGPIEIRRWK